MSPGVPKTFAKAFLPNCDSPEVREAARFSNRAGNRRSENPLLQAPAVLRAGQQEPAPKRRFALRRRLELALPEIQRRKPPHVASLERHGDGRIQNRRRAIAIPKPAVRLGE